MELETTQLSTEIMLMGDRQLPSLFRMIKADNPDHITQLKMNQESETTFIFSTHDQRVMNKGRHVRNFQSW